LILSYRSMLVSFFISEVRLAALSQLRVPILPGPAAVVNLQEWAQWS
jgi:hypothetical protein